MYDEFPIKTTTIDTRVIFFPAMVDLLASVLMIFLLIYFLQATLRPDPEAQAIRVNQEKFIEIFEKDFGKEINSKEVTINKDVNSILIRFSDKILFDTGQYKLLETGKKVLERCGKIFKKAATSGYKQIVVEGHTDSRKLDEPNYPRDNWELSTGRAVEVVKFLITTGDLDQEKFSANGYSEFKPVDKTNTEEGWSRNRRIEIKIMFSIPEQKKSE